MDPIRKLIALLLSLFGLVPTVPLSTQTLPPAQAQTHSLTVMSYNVYVVDDLIHSHDRRAPGVVHTIRSEMPDVFCLQEANADWMERISSTMPEYAYVGRGRDPGDNAGEFSPVFYNTERFTLSDGGTFWFSDTPDTPSRTWLSRYRRICSWAVLQETGSGFTFAVFNSHWDHLSVVSRNRSARLLLQKAAVLAPDMPVVLTGDFNCKENTVAYETLIDAGFADCRYCAAETCDLGSFHSYLRSDTAGERSIDHILFDDRYAAADTFRVITDKYDGMYPSDHFAIAAGLRLYQP
ncbi:MAG: endonuclease/exonuclease/phosphatase family protein [Clostridia bacterium]|nr:endonuclease/exonuclease/phosphatase family protein [Clostridia bacterium]